MHKFRAKTILSLTICSGALLSAATTPIGIATSRGNMTIDSALTAGNTTVFDGNTLQTTELAATQVRLKAGGEVRLDTSSRGKLFGDHVALEQGSARISGYAATANGIDVRTEGKGSANIAIHGKLIEVAALTGNVHIFNAQGVNVANLMPGRALSLAPQDAGASAPSSLTGCAVKDQNNFFLTDETTNVVVQLRGGKLKTNKRIQVTGAMVPNATPAGKATQVITVAGVKEVGGPCKSAAAIAAGAGAAGAAGAGAAGAGAGAAAAGAGAAAAGAGAAAGVGAATIAGVGVGVAAAGAAVVAGGTLIGLAASGTLSSTSSSTGQ